MRWLPAILLCVLVVSPAFAQQDEDENIKKALETKSITLSFSDTPIKDVLSFLADVSGMKIVLDEESDKGQTLTLNLREVTLKNVFTLIGDMADVTYAVKGGAVHFATKERLKEILGQAADKALELKSGLQKGREFTCVVSASMNATDNGRNMKAEMSFEIEGEVKDVSEDGTARIKGKAKGSASMQGPGENEKRPIGEKKFESDITKLWGFKMVEGQNFLCPGFEPQSDILPGKPVKVGDEWEANLTRVLTTFMFLMMAGPSVPDGVAPEEIERQMVQEYAQMMAMIKATTTLSLIEIKDGIAVIKGVIKEVTFGPGRAPTVDPKKTDIRIEFDTKTGAMKLFESKLRLIMPGEGDADVLFRQEIKLKEPRKEPEYAREELKGLIDGSDIVAAVEVVVFEKRETYNYYVVEVLSDVKGAAGKQHLDILAAEAMDFDKGDKVIMFLARTEESGRKMYKLADPQKGITAYSAELLKRVTEAAGSK